MLRRSALYALLLVALFVGTSCGPGGFDKYDAGTVELWVGSDAAVDQECRRRGVGLEQGYDVTLRVRGCYDWVGGVIVSTNDPKIIAHEFCHVTTGKGNERCVTL